MPGVFCGQSQGSGLFDASIGDRFGHRNLQAWLADEMDTDEIMFSLAGRNDKDTTQRNYLRTQN